MDAPLKIQQLRYVLAVADYGTYRLAAEALHRTQPAISLGIKELEARFGEPIFERQGAGKLTPFGDMCLPKFREILGLHDRITKTLDDAVNERAGRIELATVPSVARRYLPRVLNQFLQAYPNIEVGLHDGSSEFVAERVRNGEVEFGICSLWSGERDLAFEPVIQDAVGVVCHQSHPLANANSLSWHELVGQQLIRNGTSRLLEGTPAEVLLSQSRVFISEMISIVAMLETGTAYTTLPKLAFQKGYSPLRFIPLENPSVSRVLGFATRSNTTLSPAARTAMQMIKEQFSVQPY